MSRFEISVSPTYATRKTDGIRASKGRAIRIVNAKIGANVASNRAVYCRPLFLKIIAALALIASSMMAMAAWRLFHFTH